MLSGISDFLFGTDPSMEEVDLLTGRQQELLNTLMGTIEEDITGDGLTEEQRLAREQVQEMLGGTPEQVEQAQTQIQDLLGATPEGVQPAMEHLQEQMGVTPEGVQTATEHLSGLLGGPTEEEVQAREHLTQILGQQLDGGALARAQEAIEQQLGADPTAHFEETVAAPMRREMEEQVTRLRDDFVGPGTFWGGARAQAEGEARGALADTMARELAEHTRQEQLRQANLAQQLAGVGTQQAQMGAQRAGIAGDLAGLGQTRTAQMGDLAGRLGQLGLQGQQLQTGLAGQLGGLAQQEAQRRAGLAQAMGDLGLQHTQQQMGLAETLTGLGQQRFQQRMMPMEMAQQLAFQPTQAMYQQEGQEGALGDILGLGGAILGGPAAGAGGLLTSILG